jgi:hypothetical protein
MNNAKLPISIHLFFYIALYLIGGVAGMQGGWILTDKLIIQAPWHVPIWLIVVIAGVYLPKLVFAKTIPAICPSCGGTAFLKWNSKPLQYICTECANVHKTIMSLSGR